jgi:hypothetical protein
MTAKDSLEKQPKYKLFRTHCAVTLEWACSSDRPGLLIEGAERSGPSATPDWSHKLVLQLNPSESFSALAVILGSCDLFEARYHGESKNKSFKIERRAEGEHSRLTMSLSAPKRSINVRLDGFDSANVCSLLVLSCRHGMPYVSEDSMVLNYAKLLGGAN